MKAKELCVLIDFCRRCVCALRLTWPAKTDKLKNVCRGRASKFSSLSRLRCLAVCQRKKERDKLPLNKVTATKTATDQ